VKDMDKKLIEKGFFPYVAFFPRAQKGSVKVVIEHKFGKVKTGEYLFVEFYCATKDCDCREVALVVLNEQHKQLAVIVFPLDIDLFSALPRLHEEVKQTSAAEDLLEIFVNTIVAQPQWFRAMCQNYRAVRKKVDEKPYVGERFPSSKYLQLLFEPFEDDDDVDEEEFFAGLKDLIAGLTQADKKGPKKQPKTKNSTTEHIQGNLFPASREDVQLSDLISTYSNRLSAGLDLGEKCDAQLRTLMRQDDTLEELVSALVESYRAEDDIRLQGISQLLYDVLDILRTDMERRRPGAAATMNHLQTTLAQQVFQVNVDPGLGAEVTKILLDARVEILPLLHEANSRRMAELTPPDGLAVADQQVALQGLFSEFEKMGVSSEFEMADMLLQMMAIGEPDVQINLYTQMFYSVNDMAREAAVLMLFHPDARVRTEVAELIAGVGGADFSPIMLRRLIIARNWFPESMRKKLDLAINNARRARIACAPLANPVKVQVYASIMDGANAQSFMVVLPRGKGFLGCSLLLKNQHGVADAFILPLADKAHLRELKQVMNAETGSLEISRSYLNQRVCHALADGAAAGKVPSHWLLAIAEQLGSDQWKAVALDCEKELQQLTREMQQKKRPAVLEMNKQKALQQSSQWLARQDFAASWFEDDVEVDDLLNKYFNKNFAKNPEYAISHVVDKILESRRLNWQERLVVATLWLRAALKSPISWEQMYYVAVTVADRSVPLKKIPLMRAIADNSIGAFFGRKRDNL